MSRPLQQGSALTDPELHLTKVNEEVFIASQGVVRLDARSVGFIRNRAVNNARGRARICAHKNASDPLHEMLIAMRHDSYIRPHRHLTKVESFHLVEGAADIVILTDVGEIDEVIELSADRNFFYRLSAAQYHTVLINSPVLVIHEVTNGPFDPTQSDFASFAPAEGDDAAIGYVDRLRTQVRTWKAERVAQRELDTGSSDQAAARKKDQSRS